MDRRPLPQSLPLTGSPSSRGSASRGSGWIDRTDANRSRRGIQRSRYFHPVQEILSPLLLVELISGQVVRASQDKFVPGFHYHLSAERHRSSVLIICLQGCLQGLLLNRRRLEISTLRQC